MRKGRKGWEGPSKGCRRTKREREKEKKREREREVILEKVR